VTLDDFPRLLIKPFLMSIAFFRYLAISRRFSTRQVLLSKIRDGDGKWRKSDVWLTVHRNSVWLRKTNQMSLFVFFISLLIVAEHVSGNHVPIIRS
jgi:hypothetical protein